MPLVTTVRGRVRPGPHIFVAIPSDKGIAAETFTSFFEAAQMLDAAGYNVTLCTEAGNCHVDDARNSLVREFLKTDCTDLVFIDADVGFPPENLFRIVLSDRDVVAGVYPKKQDEPDFPVMPIAGEIWAEDDGLVEVEGVPTGFLRIKRHVLEKLCEKAVSFIGQAGDPLPYHVIFERIVVGNRRMSGDYAFCHKWREAGGRIYVDPELAFTHTGEKVWGGTLGDHWRNTHGVAAAQQARAFDRAMKRLVAGKPECGDFRALTVGWGNGWSASPEMLEALWENCSGKVLECGSGLSTLVLAVRCKVTALEHDPMYASHTKAMLARYGLDAEIVVSPLKDGWYDFDGGEYDALVIDGPPRSKSDRSEALKRNTAPLVIWDDYESGLPEPVVVEGANRFAIWREA